MFSKINFTILIIWILEFQTANKISIFITRLKNTVSNSCILKRDFIFTSIRFRKGFIYKSSNYFTILNMENHSLLP